MKFKTLLNIIGITWMLAAIFLLYIYDDILENVVHGVSFSLILGFGGVLLVVLFIVYMWRNYPDYLVESNDFHKAALVGHLIGVVFVFMFTVAFYSVWSAKQNTYQKTYRVVKKMKNIKSKTYYLKLQMENREERFNPPYEVWDVVEEGDSILLTIGKSQLGYEHVLEFADL